MIEEVKEFFKKKGAEIERVCDTLFIFMEETDAGLLYEFDGLMSRLGLTLKDIIPPDIISPTYMRVYVGRDAGVVFEYIEVKGSGTVVPVKVTVCTSSAG